MSKKLFWPILIILFAVVAGLLVWGNSGSVLRPLLLGIFMLVLPGLAFTRLLNLNDPIYELVLAVALSLVISTILAEFLVLSGSWSPVTGLIFLIGISLIGASLQIINALRPLPQGGD